MFHQGDLQSGISLAIEQQKLVAVFVRQDDDYWSTIWHDYWLANKAQSTADQPEGPPLGEVIGSKAVLLKIEFGSQEASFLSAFCPITKAPTLVIIQNGQVLEKLEGGIGQDAFLERLLTALGLAVDFEEVDGGGQRDAEEDPGSQAFADRASKDDENVFIEGRGWVPMEEVDKGKGKGSEDQKHEGEASGTTRVDTQQATPGSETTPVETTPAVLSERERIQQEQTLLKARMAERAKLHSEAKARRDAAAEAHRKSRAEARRKEAEASEASQSSTAKDKNTGQQKPGSMTQDAKQEARARSDWMRQQKQRNDEAKRERQRIMQRIESDKQERKHLEQERKEAAQKDTDEGFGGSSELPASHMAARARSTGAAASCALQIRLFDGSSIKNKFPSDANLATSVRTWVRETAPEGSLTAEGSRGQTPFGFRQILAPRPSRSIEISEEQQSLAELGFTPTATLVLVPVLNTQDAYAAGDMSSIFSRAFTDDSIIARAYLGINGLIIGVFSVAASLLGYITGGGDSAATSTGGSATPHTGGAPIDQDSGRSEGIKAASSDGASSSSSTGNVRMRMKTLADQRAEEEDKKKTEFYNGNSLGFEGRRDDNEDQNN